MAEEMIPIPARMLTEEALYEFFSSITSYGDVHCKGIALLIRERYFGLPPVWKPEVGEKIWVTRMDSIYTIRAIHKEQAWCESDTGCMFTWHVSDLRAPREK